MAEPYELARDDLFLPEPNDPDVLRGQAESIRARLTGG